MAVTTEMSLQDLVELSLGTPEVVNYCGLRTLLLAIVNTLKLGEVKAEMKEADKRELLASQNDGEVSRPVSSRTSPELLELEKKVSKLEMKLDTLDQLPSNEDLMDRVKSAVISPSTSTSQTPVSEMWQLMQVQKKAQSNEEGVSKLMSMVEHLMGEFQDQKSEADSIRQQIEKMDADTTKLQEQLDSMNESNSSLTERLGTLESGSENQEKMNKLQEDMESFTEALSSLPPIELIVTWPAMEDALKGVHQEPREVSSQMMQTSPGFGASPVQTVVSTTQTAAQTVTPSPQQDPAATTRPMSGAHPSQEIQTILKDIGELNGKHNHLEERVDSLEEQLSKKADLTEVERMVAENAMPEDLSSMIGELKEGLNSFQETKEKLSSLQELLDGYNQDISVSPGDLDELRDSLENRLRDIYDRLDAVPLSDVEPLSVSVPSDLENQVQQDLARLSDQIADQFSSQFMGMNDRMGNLESLLDSKLTHIGRKLQKVKNFLQEDLKSRLEASDHSAPSEVERIVFERDTPSPCYDTDLIAGITAKISDLQAEADKLNQTCIHMLDEHSAKQKHIDALYDVADKLQANKADKEHVTMEIDVKADKQALENKISRNQFERTVEEISKNLSNVMENLSGHQSAWEQELGEIKSDVESKLDRLELDPLKAYLDKKIKAVNAKLIRREPDTAEDAAGFRKQLVQKYHCISCDRPLDMAPHAPLASLPESKGLPGTRSGRPYTTFELEQIRAAQKRGLPGKNVNHYERALLEQEAARQRKQDIVAYLVHFEKNRKDLPLVRNCMSMGLPCLPHNRHITYRSLLMGSASDYFIIESISRSNSRSPGPGEVVDIQDTHQLTECPHTSNGESLEGKTVPNLSPSYAMLREFNRKQSDCNQYHEVPDYYATNRSCGGSHTLTYPHRRVARVSHLQNTEQPAEIPTTLVNGKIETDVIGQDGHIYKARVSPTQLDHLPTLAKPRVQSARARSRLGSARMRSQTAPSMSNERQSPRPSSSRHPSRPQSGRPVRPQSGRHSRSPPSTAPAAGDGRTPTSSQNGSSRDGGSVNGVLPATVDEIAVELPGGDMQGPSQMPT